MKYLLIFTLGFFTVACSNGGDSDIIEGEEEVVEEVIEDAIEDSQQTEEIIEDKIENVVATPTFSVVFPDTGFDVKKTSRENEAFQGSKAINWIMEGRDVRGSFMYYVNQDVLSEEIKRQIKDSGNDLEVFLNGVLSGGVSNFNGQNLTFEKQEMPGYVGLMVRGTVEGDGFKGVIKYKAYTDGNHIFIVGSAGQNLKDADLDPFLSSFQIN